MKKRIILVIVIIIFVLFSGLLYKIVSDKYLDSKFKELSIGNIYVKKDKSLGSDIYRVYNKKKVNVYNNKYRKEIDKKMDILKLKKYTIEKPLLILNPYGTNKAGLNIYFDTKENVNAEYTVKIDGFNDFSRTLYNKGKDKLTKRHSYQLIGLIPGFKNKVIIKLKNKEGKVLYDKEFNVDLTKIKTYTTIRLKTETLQDENKLTNGLFVVIGNNANSKAQDTYLYDNDGVLRYEIKIPGYHSDRLEFIGDNMLYSCDVDKLALVDRLGRVVDTYNIKGYKMHHDYIYDKDNKKLLILASKVGDNAIEDRILSLDLKTKKYKEIINMQDYLKKVYETAIPNKSWSKGLDWLHLNSLSKINKNDIVLTSREISTIIYMQDIYTKPKIKYLIANEEMIDTEEYKDVLYKKEGDFINQGGIHTVTYLPDKSLPKGQYYLYIYNNNFFGTFTREGFLLKDDPALMDKLENTPNSMFYKYLVDENKKTYKLVQQIDLPYSSFAGSAKYYKNNLVTLSAILPIFGEYDEDGKLIKQYSILNENYTYRVFKYSFNKFWFK